MRVPGGVWRSAFSIRLIVEAVQLVARALDDGRLDVERDLVVARSPGRARRRPRRRSARGRTARAATHARRRRCARAAAGRRPAGACAARSAAPSAAASPSLAVQRFGQQLEVGEHARQRRAQLVRGVGDEAPLAREHRLGLATRGVELAEHPLQRARELGDLVVGLRLGHAARGVARARDLRGGGASARRSAPSRGARSPCRPAAPGRVPASTPTSRNSSHARDRRLGVGDLARRTG